MTAATITEKCKCGAEFTFTGDPTFAYMAVLKFRDAHLACRAEDHSKNPRSTSGGTS